MMQSIIDEKKVRKKLFDLFRQMRGEDVEAAQFFIRGEHRNRKCESIYDLMEVLEKLAYFVIRSDKVKLKKLIELFENIDRADLKVELEDYAKELGCGDNGDDSSGSCSSYENGRKKSRSSEDSESSEEKAEKKGYKCNESIFSPEKTNERESAEDSSSEEEETNPKGSSPCVSSNEEAYESESPEASESEEDKNPTGQVDEEVDTLETDMLNMSLDPQVIAETTINEQFSSSSDEKPDTSINSGSENITLYNYQLELGEKGKTGVNSVICSPTGSGKTITAASIIQHNLEGAKEHGRVYRVLYLVHIRYLVQHLSIDLKRILGDDVYPLGDEDLLTDELVRGKAVVILTAQILVNDLNAKKVDLRDYDLLVFDECHNTVKKHPYNEIMKRYHEIKRRQERVPNVLGLSATLGGKSDPFEDIVDLCANLFTMWVSCVRNKNNVLELRKKNKAPMIDRIIIGKTRKRDEFSEEISRSMRQFLFDLEIEHEIQFLNPQLGSTELESLLSQKKEECEIGNLRIPVKIIKFLIIMNKALIYYNDLTAIDTYEYLEENFPEPDRTDQAIDEKIASIFKITLEKTKNFAGRDLLKNNDKLLKLKDLLIEILKPNPNKQVILLCQTRFVTVHLKSLLMEDIELREFVKADFLIGQSQDKGLTQNQQAKALKKFKDHELNLLLATSIAEQGLNIEDCEIVIRYLYVTSAIGRRQAQGRARKEMSKCYLIAEEDNDHIIREYRNKAREKEMDVALEKVTEMGEQKFKVEVLEAIKELHENADFKKRAEEAFQYQYRSEDIDIICRECHQFLCRGSDIIKKGSDYICVNPDFESKVDIEVGAPKVFRLDSIVGNSRCNGENCRNWFGAYKTYKHGNRRKGYTIACKSFLLQVRGYQEVFALKKWSQHPFPIDSEPLR